ncbi:electron transport complex subunit C [Marinobacterium nitratireducens]|uniref:Ion-translocating oxidoreductase complex subunit C n=1 Tax=Marinobacterium nitratireducens TaxID=518897 RepID=A0A918DTX6_9GAMM|nr:electron transport complex subunit RsxC [Marinobacterium nitratireducens]GGO83171.1 electron transport complex subunit C [Marinobacterium nitratireducens]
MGHVFAFHGGIHPPENKRQSTRKPIRQAPLPQHLVLPLAQHLGAPAEPLVKPGDRVLKGQLIASAAGRVSAALHAPTSGVISSIGPYPVPHASGMEGTCIMLEADGEERWIEHQGLADFRRMPKSELIDFIRNSGIAGMGGAGFPTDVKLHLGEDHIVNTLIINAAECEPYITADDMLMRERAEDIVAGIEVIAHLLEPSHILIGTEDNKPQAVRALEKALKGCKLNIDIRVVPTKYPSGGEKQLIKLLTDVEVPSGRIPADVGIVCQNVGTAYAIARAVRHGEPLISRIVTLTGDALGQPQNFETLIGTPYQLLLEASRVSDRKLYRLVVGGPMMGFAVDNDQIPVIKTTNCLIASTYDEMPPAPPAQECIRCGLCEQVCPAELLPQQLYWFAKGRELDKAKHHNLFDCIECGACSYVCSSYIPLVQYYRNAKAEIRTEEAEQRKAEHARQRFEARQARLEAEKAEKEARRKARAEEAARNQAKKKDQSEAVAAAPSGGVGDLKALKTAAAVARTKLKKAQKAVDSARESGSGDLAALESELQQAQQKADAAQQALDAAERGDAQAAGQPDLKQLKTAAAVARTKLKQAEKALKNAEDKGQDGVEALRATVQQLTAKAEAAQQAYETAEKGESAGGADTAKVAELKADMDAARGKVEKAQKALDDAIASGSPAAEKMKAGVEKLQGKYEDARKAWEAAAGTAQPGASPAKLAELKADMHAAGAKVEKAQKALDDAIASGSPAAEKMKAGVAKLQGKYNEAHKAWLDAGGEAQAPTQTEKPDLKALKQQVSIMRTKLKKAEKALEEGEGSEAEVQELRQRHDAAKAELDGAEQARIAEAAAAGVDLKQLQIDAALARAAVTKAERALGKAGDDDREALRQALQEANLKAEELNQTLSRFE